MVAAVRTVRRRSAVQEYNELHERVDWGRLDYLDVRRG